MSFDDREKKFEEDQKEAMKFIKTLNQMEGMEKTYVVHLMVTSNQMIELSKFIQAVLERKCPDE